MKRILLPAAVLMCLTVLLLSGCHGLTFVVGSGNIVSKQYDLKDFTNVEVSSAFQVQINQSASYSVTASSRENVIDHMDISQIGNTVKIRLKPGSYTNADTKATITMPVLNKLTLSGASKGNIQGFKSTNDFDSTVSGASQLDINMETGKTSIDISGAGRVSGQLKALDTQITISGASRCELTGSAGDADFNVSGASQANTQNFQLQNAVVEVSGASRATINTNGSLSVDVTGASTLEYLGKPTLNKINVNGASRLVSK
jgi:hypothetical protein